MEIVNLLLDTKAIEEGRWRPLGADFPGVEVLVSGLSAPKAKALHEKMLRKAPAGDRHRNGTLTADAEERIVRTVILERCLHDWRGFTRGGQPLAYNREDAELFMLQPEGRVISKAIVEAIIAIEDTRAVAVEESSGN